MCTVKLSTDSNSKCNSKDKYYSDASNSDCFSKAEFKKKVGKTMENERVFPLEYSLKFWGLHSNFSDSILIFPFRLITRWY